MTRKQYLKFRNSDQVDLNIVKDLFDFYSKSPERKYDLSFESFEKLFIQYTKTRQVTLKHYLEDRDLKYNLTVCNTGKKTIYL